MEQRERRSAPQAIAQYGRYEALFKIASGGMAEVFAARMLGEGGFEKMVALKRMLPTLAEDEKFVAMFLDEGRLAANIASPHVVQTLDLGRADDDSLYLVMELVVGVSLSALMKKLGRERASLPIGVAVEIVAQAAQGLHDAHEARTVYGEPLGIVHRDVSPQNVLLDVTGRARITDFGVARALQRMTNTQSGEVKGKLAYFAPEQARAKELDRRADVFALGIVAWETIGGQRLFAGDNPVEVLMKLMELPVPRLDQVRDDVPPALADVVAAALERDLDRRTPTAAAFARALRSSCESASPSEVATFVRAHGGESLMRLEEGLRSVIPSSPGARSISSSGVRVGVVPAPPRDDTPTLLTPSSALVPAALEGSAGVRVIEASAPSMAAPAARGVSWPVLAAIVLFVAAAAAAGAWAIAARGGETGITVEQLPTVTSPAPSAPIVPSSPADRQPAALEQSEVPAQGEPPRAEPPRRGRERRAEPRRAEAAEPQPAEPQPAESQPREPQPPEPQPPEPQPAEAQPPEPQRVEPAHVEREAVRAPEAPAEPPPRVEPRVRREPPPAAPAEPPRRTGALRGLDDFERELSR